MRVCACACVDVTRWEGQTESLHGLQDAKHEVKHRPLGWTRLLRAATHTHRKTTPGMLHKGCAHVKRGYLQFAHVDNAQRGAIWRRSGGGAHMREGEHTHSVSALRFTPVTLEADWVVATHKQRTQGPSLFLSQAASSMCLMSSS